MKRPAKPKNIAMQIGATSLPVMAALLAAVLYAMPHRTPDIVDLEESLAEAEPQIAEMQNRANHCRRDIEKSVSAWSTTRDLLLEGDGMAARIARVRREEEMLRKHVSEAREKIALAKRIEELENTNAVFDAEIADLDKKTQTLTNIVDFVGLDIFPRPYVVLECRRDTVVVYAPRHTPKTITPPLSSAEAEQLRAQIEETKGVIVFARAASFRTTYPKLRTDLHEMTPRDGSGCLKTALTYVALQDHEDITGHILLGGGG